MQAGNIASWFKNNHLGFTFRGHGGELGDRGGLGGDLGNRRRGLGRDMPCRHVTLLYG